MQRALHVLAERGGDVGEAVLEGRLAGGRGEPREQPRRLDHRPVAHEADPDLAHVARLLGIVGGHDLVLVGAEAGQHARPPPAGGSGMKPNSRLLAPIRYGTLRLPPGAERGLRLLRDDLPVDHRPRVGVALLAHGHEVQAPHEVRGGELAQRGEGGRVLAGDAGELRERDAHRLGLVQAPRAS